MGLIPSLTEKRGGSGPRGDGSALAALGIAAVAIACCGAPLLVAAVVTTGAGSWLFAHGSLIGIPAIGVAGGLIWWRWWRSRC